MKGGLKESTGVLAQDGFLVLKNISRRYGDMLCNRPGLANRLNASARVMAGFVDSSGDEYLLTIDSTVLKKVDTTYDSSAVNVQTGVDGSAYGTFASIDGRMYYADGTGVWVVDPDLSGASAGISAPSDTGSMSAVAGSSSAKVTPGSHLVRYFYKDTDTGYVSGPSIATAVDVPDDGTDDKIEYSFGASGSGDDVESSADAKVDQVIVQMTESNGSYYYDIATLTNGSGHGTKYLDDEDWYLRQQTRTLAAIPSDGGIPASDISIIFAHTNRLFYVYEGNTKTGPELRPSEAGYPEQLDASEGRVIFDDANGDAPTAGVSAYGDIYLFGLRTAIRFSYTSVPSDGRFQTYRSDFGAWNARCVVMADGALYGAGPSGVWQMTAQGPMEVSGDVRETLRDDVDTSVPNVHHLVYSPMTRELMFFYAESGDTACGSCLCYHTESGQWHSIDFPGREIYASCLARDANGDPRVWLSDGNYIGKLEYDLKDFVLSGADAVLTVASSSTTTIVVDETLADDAVKGAMLHDPQQDENRRITTNTGSTLTIASAFTSDPPVGRELYAGSYDIDIKPKWYYQEGGAVKTRGTRLHITQVPDTDSGSACRVYTYKDMESTAVTRTKNDAAVLPNGWSVTTGNTYGEFDLDEPFLALPVLSIWERFFTYLLRQRRPGDFRLVEMKPSIERQDAAKITDE